MRQVGVLRIRIQRNTQIGISSSGVCSLRASSTNKDTSSLSSSEVMKFGLRMVLFSINAKPKMERDRKRRKPNRLIAKPFSKFIRPISQSKDRVAEISPHAVLCSSIRIPKNWCFAEILSWQRPWPTVYFSVHSLSTCPAAAGQRRASHAVDITVKSKLNKGCPPKPNTCLV